MKRSFEDMSYEEIYNIIARIKYEICNEITNTISNQEIDEESKCQLYFSLMTSMFADMVYIQSNKSGITHDKLIKSLIVLIKKYLAAINNSME
jgi:hypothetical protein